VGGLGEHVTSPVGFIEYTFTFLLYSSARGAPTPVDRFWRSKPIRPTTFSAQGSAFGDRVNTNFGDQINKKLYCGV